MKQNLRRIQAALALTFAVAGLVILTQTNDFVRPVEAFSEGPPPGHTGGPGEITCANCHSGVDAGGQFVITPPQNYVPGRTYQIVVRHTNPDTTRIRWGFQLTSLAGTTMAGTLANTDALTQIVGGIQRDYVEHTGAGTFAGTTGGASWRFNWTAPPTDVGPVTFYAAGNQANGDGGAGGDRILTATATSNATQARAPFDFDGDAKTDIGIFRPSVSEWWIRRSTNASVFAAQFGAAGDVVAPGDFTGDGKADVTIWRPATGFWFVLRSEDSAFFAFPFGANGDIPVPSDFDGDGSADAAVFRPSQNLWFIRRSSGGTEISQFGIAGDQPVPADYDGDKKADIAIRRPNGPNGAEWWLNRSSAGLAALIFGTASDKTVYGDYTGDGKADVAFWRPSTGFWFILKSEDLSFFARPWGANGDIPAPGDYDGDGKFDLSVFRPGDTNWYIDRSSAGVQIVQFGVTGDAPLPNTFVR